MKTLFQTKRASDLFGVILDRAIHTLTRMHPRHRAGLAASAAVIALPVAPNASPSITHISRLADAYARHFDLKISTVSTYAANDGKWLENIRKPSVSCTLRKAHTVLQWFAANWPADLAWPSDIPRPAALAAKPAASRKTKRAA